MALQKFLAQPIVLVAIGFILIIVSWTTSATAHHGFQGRYDSSRLMYLQGTVREVRWQAPHSVLVVKLAQLSDGTTVVRPGTVQTEVNGCGS